MVKIRQDKRVNMQGQKELLGLWLSENEGAKPVLSGAEGFWLSVMTELKNRGIKAVFVACVDGLTGFPDAIGAVFPQTQVQLCIVQRVRNSLRFVAWKDRKLIAADLKKIY